MGSVARRIGSGIAAAVLAVVTAGPADAAFITSAAVEGSNPAAAGHFTRIRFSFGATSGGLTPEVFETFVFTGASEGQTFEVTAANDPDFTALAAILTNGANDPVTYKVMRLDFSVIDQTNTDEETFFTAWPGTDLSGYTLDRITLDIERLSLEQEGDEFTGTTNVEFAGTLSFYGTANPANPVPGPSGLLLAGAAGLTFVGRAWARRRRPAA